MTALATGEEEAPREAKEVRKRGGEEARQGEEPIQASRWVGGASQQAPIEGG